MGVGDYDVRGAKIVRVAVECAGVVLVDLRGRPIPSVRVRSGVRSGAPRSRGLTWIDVKAKPGFACFAKFTSVRVKLGRSLEAKEVAMPFARALTTPRHMPVTIWFCVFLTFLRESLTGTVTCACADEHAQMSR